MTLYKQPSPLSSFLFFCFGIFIISFVGFFGVVRYTLNISLYYGLTNNLGIAQFSMLGSSVNVTYSATYQDLSSSITVYSAFLNDTFNHQSLSSDWSNTGIENVTYDSSEHCLKFENTDSTGYLLSITSKCFTDDFVIEFEALSTTAYNLAFGIRSLTNVNISNKRSNAVGGTDNVWAKIKIVRTGSELKYYGNDIEKATETVSTEDCIFRFNNDTPNTFWIKNFVAYKG